MVFVTLLALEHLMAVVTTDSRLFRTAGRKPLTLSRVLAEVFFLMTVSFLTGVAIVVVSEKSRHLGVDVMIRVVHVDVNFLVFLRTRVDDVIAVLFRHDIDLTLAKVSLKLFGLLNYHHYYYLIFFKNNGSPSAKTLF